MHYKAPTLHLAAVVRQYAQDMRNKVVVITGTTSGTGYVCAREMAQLGATVVLLNRNSKRAESSLYTLRESVVNGQFVPIECDLQDFSSVRRAVYLIQSKFQFIDILVNNAGVMALKDTATVDGYDIQMQTNVIAHFLISRLLLPLLKKRTNARIINHTSLARKGGPLQAIYFSKSGGQLGGNGSNNETFSFKGPRWERYHQTKLANCAFIYGLKQKLVKQGIHQVLPLLAHPGLALTKLHLTTSADGGMDSNSDFMAGAQSAEDGACGIIRACLDSKAVAGSFYGPSGGWKGYPDLLEPEDYLYSKHNIQVNWEACEAAVGVFNV